MIPNKHGFREKLRLYRMKWRLDEPWSPSFWSITCILNLGLTASAKKVPSMFFHPTKRSHPQGYFSYIVLVGSLPNTLPPKKNISRWSPVPARWFRWAPLMPRMGPTVMIRSQSRRCGETPRRLPTGFLSKRTKPSQNQRTKQQNDLMDTWWIWWMSEYIFFFQR